MSILVGNSEMVGDDNNWKNHPLLPKYSDKDELIHHIISELKIPLESILNMYLVGSRLYNCHEIESDYDIFVIVKDDFQLPPIDNINWLETEGDEILLSSQESII